MSKDEFDEEVRCDGSPVARMKCWWLKSLQTTNRFKLVNAM